MTSRLLLTAFLLFGVTLASCDAGVEGDPDGISGIWTGLVEFDIDTLVATPAAVRIKYDADVTVELRLRHENGLVNGTMQRTSAGTLVQRSAWGLMDSLDLATLEPTVNAVYGTYDSETQRLDLRIRPRYLNHPTCGTDPYEYSENFLVFSVFGRNAGGDAYVGETRTDLVGSNGSEYQFSVRSENRLAIDRDTDLPPELRPLESDPRELVECAGGSGGGGLTTPGAGAE